MEQPCAKCGSLVEQGVPFCPHCRAPQIRVAGFEGLAAEDTPRAYAGVDVQPVLPSGVPHSSDAVQWHEALPAAALGGLVSIIGLSLASLSSAFVFFGLAAGGITAVWLYRVRLHGARPSAGAGAKIGAAAGCFSFLIMAVLMVAALVYQPEVIRQQAIELAQQIETQFTTWGLVSAPAQEMIADLKTAAGLRRYVEWNLVTAWILLLTASSTTGALCAAFLRRR